MLLALCFDVAVRLGAKVIRIEYGVPIRSLRRLNTKVSGLFSFNFGKTNWESPEFCSFIKCDLIEEKFQGSAKVEYQGKRNKTGIIHER